MFTENERFMPSSGLAHSAAENSCDRFPYEDIRAGLAGSRSYHSGPALAKLCYVQLRWSQPNDIQSFGNRLR